jgi:hypothetical protein
MKPKHVYLASVAAWALLCLGHFVFRTHAFLTGPRDGDLYSYSWSFQSVMFLIFRFPLWFVALALVLLFEIWHFSRCETKEIAGPGAEPSGNTNARLGNSGATKGPPLVS